MQVLAIDEVYDHLKIPIGFQVRQTPISTIAELIEDLRAVDQFLLTLWQKHEIAANLHLTAHELLLVKITRLKEFLERRQQGIKKVAQVLDFLSQRGSA